MPLLVSADAVLSRTAAQTWLPSIIGFGKGRARFQVSSFQCNRPLLSQALLQENTVWSQMPTKQGHWLTTLNTVSLATVTSQPRINSKGHVWNKPRCCAQPPVKYRGKMGRGGKRDATWLLEVTAFQKIHICPSEIIKHIINQLRTH